MAKQKSGLPSLVAYPPLDVRKSIEDSDWTTCLTAWNSILNLYLVCDRTTFSSNINPKGSLVVFVTTYLENVSSESSLRKPVETTQALELRRNTFRVMHRLLLDLQTPPPDLLTWSVLGDACREYGNSMKVLLRELWNKHRAALEASVTPLKTDLIKKLGSSSASVDSTMLSRRVIPFMHASASLSLFLMTGSDLVDSIISRYGSASTSLGSSLVVFIFLGLSALMEDETANNSLLYDHLYSLRENAEKMKSVNSTDQILLSDLVNKTPFLSKMKNRFAHKDHPRLQKLIVYLGELPGSGPPRPKKHIRRKIDRRKGEVTPEFGHQAVNGVHVHRMSLISQVQDLFPDLGSGFIVKLLDQYHDNVEQVTANLLENTLPAELLGANRSEQLPDSHNSSGEHAAGLEPRPTPPPSPTRQRRNVFDDDDFDRLAVKASSLHLGRKDNTASADKLLAERGDHASGKAAIMSALAAFDADDDERDDTYDVSDVGGTVDAAKPGGADEPDADIDDMREKNEEALFSAFKMNPEAFDRDAATRRGQVRQALKSETEMTDEAIEGWALMIKRDPKRLRRLELKYSTYGGEQRALASTKWQATPDGSTENSEASGAEGSSRGRGGGMRRGRGRGRGRAGNVAGATDEKSTQQARDRKEQNKGSRANHNRRDQRARKVARSGFPG